MWDHVVGWVWWVREYVFPLPPLPPATPVTRPKLSRAAFQDLVRPTEVPADTLLERDDAKEKEDEDTTAKVNGPVKPDSTPVDSQPASPEPLCPPPAECVVPESSNPAQDETAAATEHHDTVDVPPTKATDTIPADMDIDDADIGDRRPSHVDAQAEHLNQLLQRRSWIHSSQFGPTEPLTGDRAIVFRDDEGVESAFTTDRGSWGNAFR